MEGESNSAVDMGGPPAAKKRRKQSASLPASANPPTSDSSDVDVAEVAATSAAKTYNENYFVKKAQQKVAMVGTTASRDFKVDMMCHV